MPKVVNIPIVLTIGKRKAVYNEPTFLKIISTSNEFLEKYDQRIDLM